jgi:cysteine-rich repeat protein
MNLQSLGHFAHLAMTGVPASALAMALALGTSSPASAGFSEACAFGDCDYGTTAADTATAPPHHRESGSVLTSSAAAAAVQGLRVRAFALAASSGPNRFSVIDGALASYVDRVKLDSPTPFASATLQFSVKLTGGFSGSAEGPACDGCGGERLWSSEGEVQALVWVSTQFEQVAESTIGRKWHSSHGYVDQNPTSHTVHVSMLQQDSIFLLRDLIVRVRAGNNSCLSGSEACGKTGSAQVDGDFSATLVLKDFRLFDAESGEEILDFSLTGTDGIDYVAIDRGCGNGVIDEGETCDDANYRAGDCCAPNCQIEAGECEAGECADTDDDGEHTVVDVLAALRAAVGLSECALCRCDTNDSHDLSAGDALAILKSSVGTAVLLLCAPCPA